MCIVTLVLTGWVPLAACPPVLQRSVNTGRLAARGTRKLRRDKALDIPGGRASLHRLYKYECDTVRIRQPVSY